MEAFTPSALRREFLKCSASVYGKTLLAWVVSLLITMSFSFIFTSLGTEINGYDIYEDGKVVSHVDAYYNENVSIPADAQTEVTLEEGQYYTATRTELGAGLVFFRDTLQTVMSLVVLLALPCHTLWLRGDKDRNRVDCGGMQACVHRGLRIGLLSSVPSFITYLLLLLAKVGVISSQYMTLFRLIHMPILSYIRLFVPTSFMAADLSVWQLLALFPALLLVPATCALAYLVGFKRYPFTERLVYRRKKKK